MLCITFCGIELIHPSGESADQKRRLPGLRIEVCSSASIRSDHTTPSSFSARRLVALAHCFPDSSIVLVRDIFRDARRQGVLVCGLVSNTDKRCCQRDRRWRSAPASCIEKTKANFSRRGDPGKPHMRPYPPPLN